MGWVYVWMSFGWVETGSTQSWIGAVRINSFYGLVRCGSNPQRVGNGSKPWIESAKAARSYPHAVATEIRPPVLPHERPPLA
jgi:hypothetical protein